MTSALRRGMLDTKRSFGVVIRAWGVPIRLSGRLSGRRRTVVLGVGGGLVSSIVGELGIKSGIFPLYEILDGKVSYTYDPHKKGRIPVREYLVKQGRFAHLIDEDFEYIQGMVDSMWEEWEVPGITPFKSGLELASP